VTETPPEAAETRGGTEPDWAAVLPGEPLPGQPVPETAASGEDA
jgi:hypothetical protein